MSRFENKTILVTGAGSGIGAATVRRLFQEGASIACADVRQEDVDNVVSEFGATDRLLSACVDVSDREQVTAFVARAADRFGALHGLVNSAGIRGVGNVLNFEPEAWRRVMAVNLDGTFNMCQAVARVMSEAKTTGAIVNISSGAGIRGVPNRLAYAGSKFGVVGITQTMALELGSFGIRVNAVAPGMIETPMTATMFADPENEQRIRAAHPIGRYGQPEDVAAAICFLLADEAAFITGAILPVDGGQTVGIASF